MTLKHPNRSKAAPTSGQSLIGGAMVLTAAMIIIKIIGFVYKIPHNAILDGDGVGVYRQAYEFYLIVYSVALAGFPTAISKIIVEYQKQGRYKDIRATIKVANLFFLLLGTVGAATLVLFSRIYAAKALGNPNVALAVVVVAPSIIFSCLMCTHRGYYQGMRNMTPTAVSQVVESIVRCIVGLVAAYFLKARFTDEYLDYGTVLGEPFANFTEARVSILSLAAAGAMLGVTISTFVGWLYLVIRRKIDGDGVSPEQYEASPEAGTGRYLLKQILIIGVPVTLAVVSTQLTSFFSNLIIQNRLITVLGRNPDALFASHGGWLEKSGKTIYGKSGETATFLSGCYGFGDAFFSLVPAITGSFNMSALPHIADSWLANDSLTTARHINTTLKLTTLIAAPMGFGIAALGTPILHMVYARRNPAEVAIGGPMLSILAVAAVFLALYTASNTMLNAVGRYDLPVKLLLSGGVVNLLITFILVGIPSINIKGAPVGNIFGYILVTVLSLFYLEKNTNIKIDIARAVVKPISAGMISAAAAFITYNLQIEFLYHVIRQRIATGISIGVAVIIFVLAVGIFGIITKEEIQTIIKREKILNILVKMRIVR